MAPMRRDEMALLVRRIDRKLDRVLKELRELMGRTDPEPAVDDEPPVEEATNRVL